MVSRRTFLIEIGRGVIFVATYPVLTHGSFGAAIVPTPPNTEGPFYKVGAPWKSDLKEAGDSGTILKVSGSLVDTKERPIAAGVVDVWHTNPSGQYDLDGYRYRGRIRTSQTGEYAFETFMPAGYSGRPRHIHYKISASGFEELTTQLYFEDDPFFEGNLKQTIDKDPIVRYRELIQPVVPFRNGEAVAVKFKICLASA